LPSLAPISHQRDLNSIHHPTQLPCAPHKLVRTPDTQPRQHHTHISVCKVVLRARASARRCAPEAPMLLCVRLCGSCEQRDRNYMVTIKIIDCVRLFCWRPTRFVLAGTHLASARLDFHSPPYEAAMSYTQACAHARHPAPTASHSLKLPQGRVACQGLCKMLRPGFADVVELKAAVSAQTSMSRTNRALCSRLPLHNSRKLLNAHKGNFS
jgi:hypothetical protein